METVVRIFNSVQEAWAAKNLASILGMDVKGALNHINRKCLLRTIGGMEVESNLVNWTKSFRSDRSIDLVIDEHQ